MRRKGAQRVQPIDCQNLFCEISKYARVAHPELPGKAGRTKIKQGYNHAGRALMPYPFFPPKWGINDNIQKVLDTSVVTNVLNVCQRTGDRT